MIPQYESTGEWVQRIEEQKRSEPSKKRNTNELYVYHDSGKIDKKPTGILKDLLELKRYELFKGTVETKFKDLTKEGEYVRWSDVEAIINKYLNP